MTDQTLNELLRRLREHLNSTDSVEPQSRDELARTVRDISARLDAGRVTADVSDGRVGAASTQIPPAVPVTSTPVSADARVASESRAESAELRLEELAVRFEVKHPAIAELLRQLGALLGQAGI